MSAVPPQSRKAALHALLKVALPAIEALPTEQRADAFDGVAVACAGTDPEASEAAEKAAAGIREATSAQMILRNLLPSENEH